MSSIRMVRICPILSEKLFNNGRKKDCAFSLQPFDVHLCYPERLELDFLDEDFFVEDPMYLCNRGSGRLSRRRGTLIIPEIVPSDCLTQKRESYLLRMVRVFVKDQHNDVVTGSIRRDTGRNYL